MKRTARFMMLDSLTTGKEDVPVIEGEGRIVDAGGRNGYEKYAAGQRENFQAWRMYCFNKKQNRRQLMSDVHGGLVDERDVDNSAGRESNVPFFE